MIANDADTPPYVTFISTDTYKVTGKIAFPQMGVNDINATNGIEQCQWNPLFHSFDLNIPQVGGTPGADDSDGFLVRFVNNGGLVGILPFQIPGPFCRGPQGMAMVNNGLSILEGCNAVSPDNGLQNTVMLQGVNPSAPPVFFFGMGGNDQVWFDSASGHGFLAEGSLKVCLSQCQTSPPTLGGVGSAQQLGIIDFNQTEGGPDQAIFVGTAGSTARRSHSVAAWSGVYSPALAFRKASQLRFCLFLRMAALRRPLAARFAAITPRRVASHISESLPPRTLSRASSDLSESNLGFPCWGKS
jgi:hypothetical protein